MVFLHITLAGPGSRHACVSIVLTRLDKFSISQQARRKPAVLPKALLRCATDGQLTLIGELSIERVNHVLANGPGTEKQSLQSWRQHGPANEEAVALPASQGAPQARLHLLSTSLPLLSLIAPQSATIPLSSHCQHQLPFRLQSW